MKRLLILLSLCLALALAATTAADVVGQNDKDIQAVADPILDNLLAGFNENNYQKYQKDFDDNLKEAISEQKFLRVRTQIMGKLGKYQSRAFLGSLKQNNMSVVLYKGKFEKSDSDVLIKLVLNKRGDKILVAGLWFQ